MIGGYRVLYDDADAESGEKAAIRAVDGRISPQDARRIAHAVLQSVGMERKGTPAIEGDPGPEPRA